MVNFEQAMIRKTRESIKTGAADMKNTRAIKNNRGSILVGVVALAVFMAIAGIGFLQVTTTSVNNETAALENDKAFNAAESGIWVGARWLRGYNGFTALTAASNGLDIGPFGNTPISINGMDVYVKIPVQIGADAIPCVSIVSSVYKGGAPSAATFKKRISAGDVRCQTFGNYGTFYDGYQSTDADDPWWNQSTGWGGWGNRTFNGRFHMNDVDNKIYTNDVKFNGYVTVARPCVDWTAIMGFPLGVGHNGNNYNYGIAAFIKDKIVPTVAQLDQIFPDRYVPNVDKIDLMVTRTDATSISSDLSVPATSKISLPTSSRDEGYGPYKYRPTLYFNGANAVYQYRNAAGSYVVNNYGSINGKIFLSSNNLNVYSTKNGASGQVTVATSTGKSIVPIGNIVTDDYNYATGSVPIGSNNMIGLISGGFIAFNKTWIKRFNGDWSDNTKYVSEQLPSFGTNPGVIGGGSPGPSDGCGMMHLSVAIIAVKNFTMSLCSGYDGSGNPQYKNFQVKGTEWWDGMWMQQPHQWNSVSATFTDTKNHCEDYGLSLYGNHILGGYSRTISTGSETERGCAGSLTYGTNALTYTHDPRMYKRDFQPPAFPPVQSTPDGLLLLRMRSWSEGNTYN
jgi:hypothetical protein